MGKNINPKTLKGKDKHNRVLDLMGRMNTLNESTSLSELELVKKGPNGVVYGVIRENHKYFIKTTEKTSGNIIAEDFNYIGGLQNKFSEAYSSYAEATKQLNLKFDMLNESFGIVENNNIFETDGVAFDGGTGFGFAVEDEDEDEKSGTVGSDPVNGASVNYKDDKWLVVGLDEEGTPEKELDEQEYKLKVDSPAPIVEPSMEDPVEDEVDMGMEDPMGDMGDEGMEDPMGDMGDEGMDDGGEDESDPTKKIQKMTGKIGQMLRDMDDVDTDLEKYVINSVISAMHLDQFSDEDVEDIINKLEGEDEEDDMSSDKGMEDTPMEDTPMEEPIEEPIEGEEVIEEPMMAEESFKIKKHQLVESLTKKILKTNLNESWEEDFKYSGKRRNEHHDMDMDRPKTYGRYDDDEYMVDMDGRYGDDEYMVDMDIERGVSSSIYTDCSKCEGMGCTHCNLQGFHMKGDEFDNDGIADDFMTIDGQTGEYGPYDRDGDEIPSSIDMDADGDGFLDDVDGYTDDLTEYDMNGYGVDVMDSVSGSYDGGIADDFMTIDGQTGEYGPFDRDGDEIPSSIDMDADGDGFLDDEMGGTDFDIEFFSEPSTIPRPTTRPNTPTTRPGEKDRKGPWTKPNKKGKPKAGDESEVTSARRSFRKKGFFK